MMKTAKMTQTKNEVLGYVWTGTLLTGFNILYISKYDTLYFLNNYRMLEKSPTPERCKIFFNNIDPYNPHVWIPITSDIQITKILLLGVDYQSYVESQRFRDDGQI